MRFYRHLKITFLFTLIFAAGITSLYFYLQPRLVNYVYLRVKKDLFRKASLAASFLEAEGRSPGADYDRLADRVGRDLGLRVTVIAADGRVLGDSELSGQELIRLENHFYRPEVQGVLKDGMGESRRFSTTLQRELLYLGVPANLSGGRIGVVRLSLPLSDLTNVSRSLRHLFLAALLFALLFSLLVSYIASLYISNPIKQVSAVANGIAHGNLTRKAMIRTNDEIGDLARAVNHMSDQIGARMREVVSHKSRLEAVLLSMFDGVMVVDARGAILLVNETLRKAMQITADPAGKKPVEVIRNAEVQEITDKVLTEGRGVETREVSSFIEGDKKFLVHATQVKRDDALEGAVLVFHDITELRRLEKIRQDFVANVSHELRTPVSNIKGYAETLRDGAMDDPEHAREFLAVIYDEADRLARLIAELLDLARIESGSLEFRFEDCDVREIIKKVTQQLAPLAQKNQVTLKHYIPQQFPAIKADAMSLSLVFLNLIENALKFNTPGGTVEISARSAAGSVYFEVKDTGIGIPPKDLTRVFERFYRVDKARSRAVGGTGLGLSIVKHIVQAHGGEITAESTLGLGSVFHVIIPEK